MTAAGNARLEMIREEAFQMIRPVQRRRNAEVIRNTFHKQ